MPPGIMKRNSSKRKASEGSDEQEFSEEQTLIAGRPSRKAALKSHRVWDPLKPGAAKHADVEEEASGESPGTSAKRTRVVTKRTSKGVQDDGDQSDKQQDEKNTEKIEMDKSDQQEPERIILQQRKIIPRGLHSHPQPAMNKEQLALIEQEMEKHDHFDDPDEEYSDEEEEHDQRGRPTRFVLDDPNDEDFDISSRGRRGGFRGGDSFSSRGRGRGITSDLQQQQPPQQRSGMIPIFSTATYPRGGNIPRGRPRGGRAMAGIGGGIMRGRINIRQPVNYFASPPARQLTNGSIYSLQSGGAAVSGSGSVASSDVPVSRPGQQPPVVRVLRPMGMTSNFQALRPSSMTMGSAQSQQLTETNFTVNRELENYRGRVVAGTSVDEFNDIIDHMLAEYQRIVDDRSRLITSHREYVNHLKQTNQAALEMKDNKIRQLELSVEQLQQKVMVGVKQEQLRLVKQGTVPGADNQDCGGNTAQQHQEDSASPQQLHRMDIVNRNQDVVDDEDKPQQLQHMDEGGVIGDSNNNNEGGQQHHQQSYWPSSGGGQQQQRIRILGISGSTTTSSGGDRGIPQLHPNAPYFDDEMDDDEEEFDDEHDSGEMDDELGAQVTI
uniref:Uncharacterized protein n=2 Tax=Meloidogyne TaxID=189290 RepID=A0A6V7UCF4_MELEN|nr:unnamed protein product [Meloidogyne enterolobii]